MLSSIYQYTDYKQYLSAYLDQAPKAGHGVRRAWAEQIGCHTTYVSQVLLKDMQFSAEQGVKLSRALKHTEEECRYFVLLINYARASTNDLREIYHRDVLEMRERHFNLSARLQSDLALAKAQQAKYYSAWYYAAMHVALSLEDAVYPDVIGKKLGLSASQVLETVQCLTDLGIVELREDGTLRVNSHALHLDKSSEHVIKHHTNWRLQAIRSIEHVDPDDFHYSSVVSISREDLPRVKEIMIGAVEKIRSVIRKSGNQVVYSYLLDLFPVIRE